MGRAVMHPAPRFMYVNYTFMSGYLKKYPLRKYLTYPIYLDIQRITGYYQIMYYSRWSQAYSSLILYGVHIGHTFANSVAFSAWLIYTYLHIF